MTRHLWNMQSWITWVWEYLEFELKESKLLMDILRNYFSLTLRYATAWDVCWRKIICKKLRSFFNLWKFWETISTLFWDMQRPEIFVDIKIFENIWEISNWMRAIFYENSEKQLYRDFKICNKFRCFFTSSCMRTFWEILNPMRAIFEKSEKLL